MHCNDITWGTESIALVRLADTPFCLLYCLKIRNPKCKSVELGDQHCACGNVCRLRVVLYFVLCCDPSLPKVMCLHMSNFTIQWTLATPAFCFPPSLCADQSVWSLFWGWRFDICRGFPFTFGNGRLGSIWPAPHLGQMIAATPQKSGLKLEEENPSEIVGDDM